MLSLRQGIVFASVTDIHVGGTDDFAGVDQLFQPMCTPAGDPGDCKNRGEEFKRQSEHAVDKTAVEVDIGADALIHFSFIPDHLGSQSFHQ